MTTVLPAKATSATRSPDTISTVSRIASLTRSSRFGARSSASMLRDTSTTNTTSRPCRSTVAACASQPGRATAITTAVSPNRVRTASSGRALGGDAARSAAELKRRVSRRRARPARWNAAASGSNSHSSRNASGWMKRSTPSVARAGITGSAAGR